MQARQFRGQCFCTVGFADCETTTREIYDREASDWRTGLASPATRIAGHPQCHDQRVAVRFQQSVVGHGAWRDDAHHRAFHWTF